MKLLNVLIMVSLAAFLAVSCGSSSDKDKVADEDWVVLFDGTSTDNFRGYGKETFPEQGWIIEDGALKVEGSGKGEAGGGGGDIITINKYGNFELSLEWKVSEGGNSGIFYLAREMEGKPIYVSAPEMQILDNEKHPDALLGNEGNRQAGSLYDLIPAVPQSAKPAGEWNHIKILVYKGTVVHWMNGENVLEYHLWTDAWKEMCANSKFKDWPEFVDPAEEGYIGLQDHGDDVWFRNIKVREL
ncbi:MAG: DUF1080 domain-containing protein [Bacteroidales bacterium]|nr:DUF1080 domain-containing protein [Bacteroidales bacterium]